MGNDSSLPVSLAVPSPEDGHGVRLGDSTLAAELTSALDVRVGTASILISTALPLRVASSPRGSPPLSTFRPSRSEAVGELLQPPRSRPTPSPAARQSRKMACNRCHEAKLRCDGGRPCSRCVKLARSGSCEPRSSRVTQRRSVKRQRLWEELNSAIHNGDVSTSLVVGMTSGTLSPSPPYVSVSRWQPVSLNPSLEILSEEMLQLHNWWCEKQTGPAPLAVRQADLRDKLTGWAWLHTMMKEQHVQALLHAEFGSQHTLRSTDGVAARAPSRLLMNSDHLPKEPQWHHCDGTKCNNLCTFLHILMRAHPVSFLWTGSPHVALQSRPGGNDTSPAVLVITISHDDEAVVAENKRLERTGTLLVRGMTERWDVGDADSACAALSPFDDDFVRNVHAVIGQSRLSASDLQAAALSVHGGDSSKVLISRCVQVNSLRRIAE